jgi:mannose-6-phosphate isomerase
MIGMNEAIVFEPIAMERVWGGRRLEIMYGKPLPHGVPVGEVWELVDREEAQSVVHEGAYAGRLLHELWRDERSEVFGEAYAGHKSERFPLLIKLLDAKERLSVQVHPPADVAGKLGGEPKTEMWYFARCSPNARIYVGVVHGTTRSRFEELIRAGAVEQGVHEVPVRAGDSIFIPSGRLHAIGEGNVIVEIQQNSDTTYRVFDWNRQGLDGKPRALHIDESLACIDFEDIEPDVEHRELGVLAECPYFHVEKIRLEGPFRPAASGRFAVIAVLEESVSCGSRHFGPGAFFLVPAHARELEVVPEGNASQILVTTLPV